jgi:hypothetical protein
MTRAKIQDDHHKKQEKTGGEKKKKTQWEIPVTIYSHIKSTKVCTGKGMAQVGLLGEWKLGQW